MSDKVSFTVRIDANLHEWLTEQVAQVKPETTLNKYVEWLIERHREISADNERKRSIVESHNKWFGN